MNDLTYLYKLFLSCTLLAVLAACTEELEQDRVNKGHGHTARLELSLSVPPLVETKAVICAADSGSAARKAGFSYEMQVLTTDTTGVGSAGVSTKAATSLKNVYAFLFKSNGAFNGRASLATAEINSNLLLVFTDVADVSAINGRLVIIANDGLAATDYVSSTAFASFKGTYAAFQNLTLTSAVTSDVDIPYVGSATVSLSESSLTTASTVSLYRMLAKIVLTNSTFSIEGGPSRTAIDLVNAGNRYFGTPNNKGEGYDGVGSTATASGRIIVKSGGTNADTNTWYVGENVQTVAANAAYIELGAEEIKGGNTTPAIGEEYISGVGYSFTYKVYLNGYALRRNNVYNITVSVSGTLDKHLELANTANSNVSVIHYATEERGGLNIGMFGGASGYKTGTGLAPTITGVYTKHLLIQPNTSGSTAVDNVQMVWSLNESAELQSQTRRNWDHTYTNSNIDTTEGFVYDYCYNLTIGGVAKGTWYLPTQAQLAAMKTIRQGIVKSSYADYSAFAAYTYWSATEHYAGFACHVAFNSGDAGNASKTTSYFVRCVRDL